MKANNVFNVNKNTPYPSQNTNPGSNVNTQGIWTRTPKNRSKSKKKEERVSMPLRTKINNRLEDIARTYPDNNVLMHIKPPELSILDEIRLDDFLPKHEDLGLDHNALDDLIKNCDSNQIRIANYGLQNFSNQILINQENFGKALENSFSNIAILDNKTVALAEGLAFSAKGMSYVNENLEKKASKEDLEFVTKKLIDFTKNNFNELSNQSFNSFSYLLGRDQDQKIMNDKLWIAINDIIEENKKIKGFYNEEISFRKQMEAKVFSLEKALMDNNEKFENVFQILNQRNVPIQSVPQYAPPDYFNDNAPQQIIKNETTEIIKNLFAEFDQRTVNLANAIKEIEDTNLSLFERLEVDCTNIFVAIECLNDKFKSLQKKFVIKSSVKKLNSLKSVSSGNYEIPDEDFSKDLIQNLKPQSFGMELNLNQSLINPKSNINFPIENIPLTIEAFYKRSEFIFKKINRELISFDEIKIFLEKIKGVDIELIPDNCMLIDDENKKKQFLNKSFYEEPVEKLKEEKKLNDTTFVLKNEIKAQIILNCNICDLIHEEKVCPFLCNKHKSRTSHTFYECKLTSLEEINDKLLSFKDTIKDANLLDNVLKQTTKYVEIKNKLSALDNEKKKLNSLLNFKKQKNNHKETISVQDFNNQFKNKSNTTQQKPKQQFFKNNNKSKFNRRDNNINKLEREIISLKDIIMKSSNENNSSNNFKKQNFKNTDNIFCNICDFEHNDLKTCPFKCKSFFCGNKNHSFINCSNSVKKFKIDCLNTLNNKGMISDKSYNNFINQIETSTSFIPSNYKSSNFQIQKKRNVQEPKNSRTVLKF